MQKAVRSNSGLYIFNFHEKYRKLFRFIIVGCINTGIDFLTFTLLNAFTGYDKSICQIAGYSMGIINSFVMNKLWTFEDRNTGGVVVGQLIRFVSINAISLAISILGLRLLNYTYGLNIYLSKIVVTMAAQIVNYTGYKMLVFN